MENQQIAKIILNQLGGGKFVAMTGANNFCATDRGLSFRLPSRFAKKGINFVHIILNKIDLYDIEFGKVWGIKYNIISTQKSIYADHLRDIFKSETGLDTSLENS